MGKTLNNRQLTTLKVITENTLKGEITVQRELYWSYPSSKYNDGYKWSEDEKAHDHCSAIRSDIEKINMSSEVDKIIIPKNFTYKIAESEEEAKELADYYLKKALLSLRRHRTIVRKMRLNGQGKLLDEDEYYETYLRKGLQNEDIDCE